MYRPKKQTPIPSQRNIVLGDVLLEQITGRLVKDASIRTTKDNREFVTFTVVVNDRYKPKNGEEKKEARYFNCSYWLSTKVQPALKKGTIVSVFGRVNINAYVGADGAYHANLTFHANYIEIFSSPKKEESTVNEPVAEYAPAPAAIDDLPF